MKKRIISLLLVLALLPFGSAFGAGSAEDPLISLSFVEGTFIPEMYGALKVMLSKAVEEALGTRANSGSMVKTSLRAGSSLCLSQGQSFILLSGAALLESGSGTVVDVTEASEAENGELKTGHRYIVCEASSAKVSIKAASQLLLSPSAHISAPEEKPLVSPFSDVVEGMWWHDDIVRSYNRGLVNGMTPTSFDPQGNLTIAQSVKLAACMHQLYHEGSVTLKVSPSGPWYMSYVDYALENGLISGYFESYDSFASRRQFVEIFYAALPESDYEAINTIPQGSISDIHTSGDWVDAVYRFYRAGILVGYAENNIYNAHDFGPDSFITRAEVAAIMNRMFDPGARISFTIE